MIDSFRRWEKLVLIGWTVVFIISALNDQKMLVWIEAIGLMGFGLYIQLSGPPVEEEVRGSK